MSVRGENKQIQSQIIDFMNRFVLPHEDLLVFFKHKKTSAILMNTTIVVMIRRIMD
jgi:hypothetical protein